MRRSWLVQFIHKNEYESLPSYEEELNCARKALHEIERF
jgi:hypothetical protein